MGKGVFNMNREGITSQLVWVLAIGCTFRNPKCSSPPLGTSNKNSPQHPPEKIPYNIPKKTSPSKRGHDSGTDSLEVPTIPYTPRGAGWLFLTTWLGDFGLGHWCWQIFQHHGSHMGTIWYHIEGLNWNSQWPSVLMIFPSFSHEKSHQSRVTCHRHGRISAELPPGSFHMSLRMLSWGPQNSNLVYESVGGPLLPCPLVFQCPSLLHSFSTPFTCCPRLIDTMSCAMTCINMYIYIYTWCISMYIMRQDQFRIVWDAIAFFNKKNRSRIISTRWGSSTPLVSVVCTGCCHCVGWRREICFVNTLQLASKNNLPCYQLVNTSNLTMLQACAKDMSAWLALIPMFKMLFPPTLVCVDVNTNAYVNAVQCNVT